MNCRHCLEPLIHSFLDLGFSPPSNAYLSKSDLLRPEKYYPLKILVCEHCWLVQTEDYAEVGELFDENYAYFSSTSSSWLAHAAKYSQQAISKLQLDSRSFVIEVACNDGYLLKNFAEAEIPCLGIEPTAGTAAAAEKIGIPVVREFFGEATAKELVKMGNQADLIIGNNVYAHVPDINDFTRGLKVALKPGGTINLEFPHLMRLLERGQFDTVYHEHFSYLSLYAVKKIFDAANLKIWHVEELETHGGSLRVYGCHQEDSRSETSEVGAVLAEETRRGLQSLNAYKDFQNTANEIKNNLLCFLISKQREGKKVVAYGAAAKGNTLLNFAGIKADLISFVCDAAPAKQGMYLPGSHIPILEPEHLRQAKPDYILILPWNISDEIMEQQKHMLELGVKFVTALPNIVVTSSQGQQVW